MLFEAWLAICKIIHLYTYQIQHYLKWYNRTLNSLCLRICFSSTTGIIEKMRTPLIKDKSSNAVEHKQITIIETRMV